MSWSYLLKDSKHIIIMSDENVNPMGAAPEETPVATEGEATEAPVETPAETPAEGGDESAE